jgi:organic hydroperoxide reductase OsmC/OhrA
VRRRRVLQARHAGGSRLEQFPHHYRVVAAGRSTGPVAASSTDLPDIATGPPPQFDGPGGAWSPETLLCAAVADCFVLTFRSIARLARFEWLHLRCEVEGRLERADGVARFTRFTTLADLSLPAGADHHKAHELLERAERGCLVANSLNATRTLETRIGASGPE